MVSELTRCVHIGSKLDTAGPAMMLAVLANLFALPSGQQFIMEERVRQRVLDICLRDLHLSSEYDDVRAMAAAVLHNAALTLKPAPVPTEDLPEAATQLLCGCLDGISSDSNAMVRQRRLLTAGHVLHRFGRAASSLVNMLGLVLGRPRV
jgi:hypothetical protein